MQAAPGIRTPPSGSERYRTALGRPASGAAAQALAAAESYRLGRRIEREGGGEVYEATHPRLPGRFAIRMLPEALNAGVVPTEALRNDALQVASLRHPNVAEVFEVGVMPSGVPCVVMEFLEGQTLERYLAA